MPDNIPGMTDLIVQAASATDLTLRLIDAGALVVVEGSTQAAPGVVYSYIGEHDGLTKALVSVPDAMAEAVRSRLAGMIDPAKPPLRVFAAHADAAVTVPTQVTMRQARLALLAAGKLAQVDAAIDSLPEPQRSAARIEWEYSNAVQRSSPFVASLAPALAMTPAEIDALFVAASRL